MDAYGLWPTIEQMVDRIAALTPQAIASDGAAYLDRLAAEGAPGTVAITGYCMGARVGWRIAAVHTVRRPT